MCVCMEGSLCLAVAMQSSPFWPAGCRFTAGFFFMCIGMDMKM